MYICFLYISTQVDLDWMTWISRSTGAAPLISSRRLSTAWLALRLAALAQESIRLHRPSMRTYAGQGNPFPATNQGSTAAIGRAES